MILRKIFGYDDEAIDTFINKWMNLIESTEFLAFDKNFPYTHPTLSRLYGRAKLIVCTARQHRLSTVEQLKNLNLLNFFSEILVTEKINSKSFLIQSQLCCINENDWIIGDTGNDINTGKQLGIKTCAVLSGFLNSTSLLQYKPDVVLNSINDFSI